MKLATYCVDPAPRPIVFCSEPAKASASPSTPPNTKPYPKQEKIDEQESPF